MESTVKPARPSREKFTKYRNQNRFQIRILESENVSAVCARNFKADFPRFNECTVTEIQKSNNRS